MKPQTAGDDVLLCLTEQGLATVVSTDAAICFGGLRDAWTLIVNPCHLEYPIYVVWLKLKWAELRDIYIILFNIYK